MPPVFVCLVVLAAGAFQGAPPAQAPAAQVPAAVSTPDPPETEGLRERVAEFHKALRDAKFRNAMALVADDSQDHFVAMGRQTIGEFTVQGLRFDKERGYAIATVEILTEMGVMGRRMPAKVPQDSYWKKVDGVWMWHIPEIVERRTPFGVVKVPRQDLAAASKATRQELERRVKEGPTVANILGGVEVNVTDVAFSRKKDSEAEFTVANNLQGWITVDATLHSLPGFTIEPARKELASGEKLTLRLRRSAGPGELEPGAAGVVSISPLGLRRTFRVKLTDN